MPSPKIYDYGGDSLSYSRDAATRGLVWYSRRSWRFLETTRILDKEAHFSVTTQIEIVTNSSECSMFLLELAATGLLCMLTAWVANDTRKITESSHLFI